MGKSSHKSKKRRRSASRDRLAGLENKLARLINALEQREVRASRHRSPSSPLAASSAQRETPGRQEVTSGTDFLPESIPIQCESPVAVPASQERPVVECTQTCDNSGVYVAPGPIFVEYRRENRHSLYRNISLGFPGSGNKGNVTFESPPVTEIIGTGSPLPSATTADEDMLTRELFASKLVKVDALPWNELVTDQWRDLIRKGLSIEQRELLLRKYSPPETLAFLKAPKLNPEFKSGLKSNSVSKRDEYNDKDQEQAGIALCSFGEAISDLLKPEIQRSLAPEVCSVVCKINEGAKILADLFYRLSLSWRAQILPTLNILAKNTAEHILPDELLFGEIFGEEMKKAATLEKSAKDLVRTPLTVSRKVQQPIKQQLQVVPSTSTTGNYRAPAAAKTSAIRRSGAPSNIRRAPYRARSRSRRR